MAFWSMTVRNGNLSLVDAPDTSAPTPQYLRYPVELFVEYSVTCMLPSNRDFTTSGVLGGVLFGRIHCCNHFITAFHRGANHSNPPDASDGICTIH